MKEKIINLSGLDTFKENIQEWTNNTIPDLKDGDYISVTKDEETNSYKIDSTLDAEGITQILGYTPASEDTIPIFSMEVEEGFLVMYTKEGGSVPLAYIEGDQLVMYL